MAQRIAVEFEFFDFGILQNGDQRGWMPDVLFRRCTKRFDAPSQLGTRFGSPSQKGSSSTVSNEYSTVIE